MAVVHPGEQVVLDLVVEPPVQLAEPPAGHVGRGDNLHRFCMRKRCSEMLQSVLKVFAISL